MIRYQGEQIGFYALPRLGEVVCGDDCVIHMESQRVLLALIDGAGHGPEARAVTDAAVELLSRLPTPTESGTAMNLLHARLHGTPGAAAIVAVLSRAGENWEGSYVAVGDIRLAVACSQPRFLPVTDGVVGYIMHTTRPVPLQLKQGDQLLMASDGVDHDFLLETAPGKLPANALDAARKIVFNHQRDHDDSSCLVFRAP
ncbi:MAG: hypothetical protein EBS01_01450 [Verrucomicrobia bacterium]|nr:hypothetical protein [Verrucomicrobiota bacterium]